MGGLALAKAAAPDLSAGWLLGAAFVCALVAVALTSLPAASRAGGGAAALCAIVACAFLCGAAAYGINRARLGIYDTLPPREARLVLRITHTFSGGSPKTPAAAPDGAAARRPTASGLAIVTDTEPHLRELVGQPVYFSLALPPALVVPQNTPSPVIRTASVSVIGLLVPLPGSAASDDFDGYLTSAGMNFKLTRGRILALERQPSRLAAFYESARLRFSEILTTGIEHRPRQAGALRAMALGQKQDIDVEQNSLFLGSGTMHLFAISGLHIAVIATGMQFLLLVFRLPLWARLLAGTIALYLYVQITGASPSAMRAFFMVSLLQAAILLRLPANAIATLVFAALATLLYAPMQLFSASFQMSYGVVAALLLYGLPLGETWVARREPFRDIPKAALTPAQRALIGARRYLLSVLAISIAASLVSALCGAIYFKLLTPGALLVNLIIIPAATVVILSGFLSILLGLAGLAPLCVLFNHASALMLLLMENGLAFFLRIPGVSMPARFSPAWQGYAALALLLASMLFGYAQKWRLRRGGFWLPAVIVAAVLLFCMRYK